MEYNEKLKGITCDRQKMLRCFERYSRAVSQEKKNRRNARTSVFNFGLQQAFGLRVELVHQCLLVVEHPSHVLLH